MRGLAHLVVLPGVVVGYDSLLLLRHSLDLPDGVRQRTVHLVEAGHGVTPATHPAAHPAGQQGGGGRHPPADDPAVGGAVSAVCDSCRHVLVLELHCGHSVVRQLRSGVALQVGGEAEVEEVLHAVPARLLLPVLGDVHLTGVAGPVTGLQVSSTGGVLTQLLTQALHSLPHQAVLAHHGLQTTQSTQQLLIKTNSGQVRSGQVSPL